MLEVLVLVVIVVLECLIESEQTFITVIGITSSAILKRGALWAAPIVIAIKTKISSADPREHLYALDVNGLSISLICINVRLLTLLKMTVFRILDTDCGVVPGGPSDTKDCS